jgi:hypothetical protein
MLLPTETGNNAAYAMHGKIIPVIKKYDKALIQANSIKYKLFLQLSFESVTFCIFSPEDNKFLSIESLIFNNVHRIQDTLSLLKQYYSDHPWLNLPYNAVKILFESDKTTLIPAPLFDEKETDSFSRFNFSYSENTSICSDYIKHLDAYILYPVPEHLKSTLNEIFPGHILGSHSGVFIESLLINNKNLKAQKRFFVNVRKFELDIVILDGRKLLYFNSFRYSSKEDFIYFVIFVLEQLQMNPEEIELVFSGLINKNSKLFETVYKYVRSISFQSINENFNYSYVFTDIPSHYYFNLISFQLCES